jgi:hypothetical protein
MKDSKIYELTQNERERSDGRLIGNTYRGSFDDGDFDAYSYNRKSNHFIKRSRSRKPSTPEHKHKSRKRKINLFEKNNVDYLVDNNAI